MYPVFLYASVNIDIAPELQAVTVPHNKTDPDHELATVLKVAICSVLTRETSLEPDGEFAMVPVVDPALAYTIVPPALLPEPSPAVSQTSSSYAPGTWKIIDGVASYEL